MKRLIFTVALTCTLFISASAQSDDRIPRWASGQLIDSMIAQLGDNIGINQPSPTQPLVVTKAAGGLGTSSVISFDITGTHGPISTYAFQVRSSQGVGQFGIDTFFDPNGAGFMSTTAKGGMVISANNNDPHMRIHPNGNITISGGSTNSEADNFRTTMLTIKAAGNVPIGRIFESQNTMTLTNNASFNAVTSEYFRDDPQYVADVLEWGVEGISMHIAPPGTGAINPGGSDWKDLGYLRFRIDTQKASFTNVNVGVGVLLPTAKLQVTDGDVYVQTQGKGIILRATDGANCFRVTVNNAGSLTSTLVTCP